MDVRVASPFKITHTHKRPMTGCFRRQTHTVAHQERLMKFFFSSLVKPIRLMCQ